jgi:hypothetical protein
MWIHKTSEDIAADRKKLWLSFGEPSIVFIVFFISGMISVCVGPSSPYHQVQIFSDLSWWQVLTRVAIFSFIIAIIAYLRQLWFGKPIIPLMDQSKVLICNKCFRVKSPDGKQSCDCGGKLEDFNLWKWVDDKEAG